MYSVFDIEACYILYSMCELSIFKNNKLRGLSPQAKYTDQATAACRRS
jgi:hypothetical protein